MSRLIIEISNHLNDFLICQITSSLIILSVISLLGEKGEQAYWTTTIEYVLKRPKLSGIKAINTYIWITVFFSSIFYIFDLAQEMMVSFFLGIGLLVYIIYQLIKVYYKKDSILNNLSSSFCKKEFKDQIEYLKTLRAKTIEAFLEKNAKIYIENCKFLFKMIENNNLSYKLISEIEKNIMNICTFSFKECKEDWYDFYLQIFSELSRYYNKPSNQKLLIGLENFKRKNYIELFINGVCMNDSIIFEEYSTCKYEYVSNFANHILNLLKHNSPNASFAISAIGKYLWCSPSCFNVYFAKTLFLQWSYNCKNEIVVFEERENIYKEIFQYCSSKDELIGYFFSLYVLRRKIEETTVNEYSNEYTIKKNLLSIISQVEDNFGDVLNELGYLELIPTYECGFLILTKEFNIELEKNFDNGKYKKYNYGITQTCIRQL